jgi:hypothetical protein
MDATGYGILALLLPGVPGGLLTSWVVSKLRTKQPATGTMEEFFFFAMAWAGIFWLSLAIFLFCKFAL